MRFNAFNPDKDQALKIVLATQKWLPPGFEGLRFDLQQPDRPLRAQEAFPIRLTVTAADTTPLTEVPTRDAKVPPTAGGRGGADAVVVSVSPGERLHFSATGSVDPDGGGPSPAAGPEGQDLSKAAGDRRFLLGGQEGGRVGGALIGSFNNFANSFVIGTEGTVDVPRDVKELRLAVNDFDTGYADNSGDGFAVKISTLPSLNAARGEGGAIVASKVTLPQIDIVATSASQVTIGQRTYHLLTNHGGVTYQVLVVKASDHLVGGKYDWKFFLWILLLLLLILILILLLRRFLRKKQSV